MAVAAPARRTGPAEAPPRKAPRTRKSAPRLVRASAAPARLRPDPARAPRRARPKPKRASGAQRIPVAVGRTATAVSHLPDSGLLVVG